MNRNENDTPSSKWRHELVRGVGAMARKADGILFNYKSTSQEILLFENIGPPLKTDNPKYRRDLLKCFRNCVDALCNIFWKGKGNVEIASKYYVLAYVVYSK